MSLSNVFTSNLPKIDLHGMDRDTARVAINDFINDNFKLKQELFVVIHGIGSGVLKDATIKTLKANKLVKEFQIDFYNIGSTIVRLNIWLSFIFMV